MPADDYVPFFSPSTVQMSAQEEMIHNIGLQSIDIFIVDAAASDPRISTKEYPDVHEHTDQHT